MSVEFPKKIIPTEVQNDSMQIKPCKEYLYVSYMYTPFKLHKSN